MSIKDRLRENHFVEGVGSNYKVEPESCDCGVQVQVILSEKDHEYQGLLAQSVLVSRINSKHFGFVVFLSELLT